MIIGDLMVRMAADMADLKSGFERAQAQAQTFSEGVGRAVDVARNALVALGVTASVSHFASLIQQSIDAADRLNDFAQRTGLTVETLGGLEYAAKQSGTDLETLAKGTQKLSQLMAEAAGGNEKAASVFDALGVSIKGADGHLASMDETVYAMADRFASFKDGPEKSALAVEAFGKSGAALIPLLNQGGASLRELVEEYRKYGGVTTETAKRSDAFNDTMEKVKLVNGAFTRELTAALLPTLQKFADLFLELKGKGSDFGGVIDVIVAGIKLLGIGAIGVVAAFQAVGQALGALAAAGVQLAQGNFNEAWTILKEGGSDAADTVSTAMQRAKDVWNASGADMVASASRNGPAMTAPIAKVSDELKKQKDELDKLEKKWREAAEAQEGGWSPETLRKVEELNRLLETGRFNQDEYNKALDDTLAKDPIIRKEQEEINKLWKETNDIVNKVTEAWAKDLKALDDQIQKQEAANATFGLGKTALIDLTIAQLEHKIAIERSGDAYSPYAEQLEEVRQRMIRLRDATAMGEALQQQKKDLDAAAQAWNKMLDTVGQAFAGFIDDWIDNGFSAAAKNAWENFKKWALEALAQIAAKQIIVSITGAVTAGGAGATPLIPGLPGAGGGGSIFDSLLGAGSKLIGGFGDLAFAAADFAQLLGQGVGVVEAFSMATRAAGLTLGSIVPVVGAVVAAGTLIYNWVKSKEGGPKEGGFATTGETPGIGGVDSTGRWFTPGGSDAKMLEAVQSLDATFNSILSALGGSGSAVFAQGFSTDPAGTAPSNVHTGVWVGGTQVFDNPNGNVGRSPEELQAELQEQSMRAILAALQASELPAVIHDYLASIDVSTATVAQIQEALGHAAELYEPVKALTEQVKALPAEMTEGLVAAIGVSPEIDAQIGEWAAAVAAWQVENEKFNAAAAAFWEASGKVQDALDRDPKGEAMSAYADAHRSVYEKVALARSALSDLTAGYDGSTEMTNQLATATNAYRDAQVAALTQVYALRDALLGPDGLFAQTEHTLDWALMSKTDQTNWLINEAKATVDLLKTTTDPAKLQELSQLINKDLVQAFNMMSPDEQKAQHDYLKGILDNAKTITDTQLTASEKLITDAGVGAGGVIDTAQDALDTAGQKWTDAAGHMEDALADLRQAAIDLKQAAQDSKDAAAAQKQAAADAVTAASNNVTAANTQLQAAATPVTVEPINVVVTVEPALTGP